MTLNDAVQKIADEIYETGELTAVVVQKRFASLRLSDDDLNQLAIKAFGSEVNSLLTGGRFQPSNPKPPKKSYETRGSIVISPNRSAGAKNDQPPIVIAPPPVMISVDVQILHNVVLEVHGIKKPIIDFGIRDIDYMLNLYGNEISGYTARAEVFQYAKDRLKGLGKARISDLAAGELTILGRKWKTVASRQRSK